MTKTNTYRVWVRTGESGTDSNVFIQLFGTDGQSESIHLPAQDVFSFEANGTDKFVLEVPDFGELTRCCIGQDNSAGVAGWFVVDVRIKDDETDREWLFEFNQFLGEGGKLFECVSC